MKCPTCIIVLLRIDRLAVAHDVARLERPEAVEFAAWCRAHYVRAEIIATNCALSLRALYAPEHLTLDFVDDAPVESVVEVIVRRISVNGAEVEIGGRL